MTRVESRPGPMRQWDLSPLTRGATLHRRCSLVRAPGGAFSTSVAPEMKRATHVASERAGRAMKIRLFHFCAAFGLLSLGCASHAISSSDRSTGAATIVSCTADGDCQGNTFCDDGQCAAVGRIYGAECTIPDADPATGKVAAADFMCGAYICSKGRCRSCVSDDECENVLGAPTCKAVTGIPGRQCGDYSGGGSPSQDTSPPPGTSSPPAD